MPDSYYSEALKLGLKQKRAAAAAGLPASIPALDEILAGRETLGEADAGLLQIPMELIGGTVSVSRATLFSPGFMPLAPEGSEFAVKWSRLCQAHLEEGIREPVKAYEYLNRYYIAEGNKRVSVLKYFDAVSIHAHVVTITPAQDGSPEVELWNELAAFRRLSGVVQVECSKPGGYRKLQQLLGKAPDEVWSAEDRSAFLAAYFTFRQVYESAGGKRLHATAGDALLAYLDIYGYALLRGQSAQEIRKNVSKAWEDISLQEETAPIDVKLTPPEEKRPSLLTKVLTATERPLRAAFVHDARPETSSWTRSHERGRSFVAQRLDGQLETSAYFDAFADDPLAVIERAIAAGSDVVFTTSPRLLPAALRAAVEHPEVTVFNCSLNQSHRYIRTYYARMYEAKFVIGAIAGALAGSDAVGYLCDYPIFGQIAGINAFALGVQMVNPRARVYLEWSSVGGGGADAAIARLTQRGIRLISSQDLLRRGDERHIPGLSLITEGAAVNLATPLWQWGSYYEEILRRVRSHTADAEYRESGRALNYYWGMSAGVVGVQCSEKVPPATRSLAALLQESIRSGACNPFLGPLYTQSGRVLENDALLTPEQIINMDYLMENVVGEIPHYEDLSELGKATVDMVGVAPATKEGKV